MCHDDVHGRGILTTGTGPCIHHVARGGGGSIPDGATTGGAAHSSLDVLLLGGLGGGTHRVIVVVLDISFCGGSCCCAASPFFFLRDSSLRDSSAMSMLRMSSFTSSAARSRLPAPTMLLDHRGGTPARQGDPSERRICRDDGGRVWGKGGDLAADAKAVVTAVGRAGASRVEAEARGAGQGLREGRGSRGGRRARASRGRAQRREGGGGEGTRGHHGSGAWGGGGSATAEPCTIVECGRLSVHVLHRKANLMILEALNIASPQIRSWFLLYGLVIFRIRRHCSSASFPSFLYMSFNIFQSQERWSSIAVQS